MLVASVAAAATDLRLVDAVKNRDRAAASALLTQKIDVNIAQPDGATALHWAAHWDDLETADLLIRARVQVNVDNDFGITPALDQHGHVFVCGATDGALGKDLTVGFGGLDAFVTKFSALGTQQ